MKLKPQKRLKKAKNNISSLLIVGLGNPGPEYRGTRHNAGFAVIDFLAEKFSKTPKKIFFKPIEYYCVDICGINCHFVKPLTYMNRSGDILRYIMKKTGTDNKQMLLICDNMDLNPGVIRLKSRGSSASHNGIKSVIKSLDTQDFARLYIGIGRSNCGNSVVEHVLGVFDEDELKDFDESVKKAAEALILIAEKMGAYKEGSDSEAKEDGLGATLVQVMNEINRKNN